MNAVPTVVVCGVLGAASVSLAQVDCEFGKLFASDGAAGDDFGAAVAVDGTTVVVGAPEDDDAGSSSGAAYVFLLPVPEGNAEMQKLTALDAAGGDDFGFSVGISGETIVVGAPRDDTAAGSRAGSVYVFDFDAGMFRWVQTAHLFASDAEADDRFGQSVAIDGDTILVGAIQEDGGVSNSGAGYVFTRSAGVWTQQAKLSAAMPSGLNPQMGRSASLDGDVAVLGAWQDAPAGMSLVGAAHVFRRTGTVWMEEQKLTASDAADFRWFGHAVAVSGNVIAVGAFGDRADDLSESGGAYFFVHDGAAWNETQNVNASDPAADDRFGWSIALDGDNAVVGTGSIASKAYLFHRELAVYNELTTLNSSDPAVSGEYAYSVAIRFLTAVIGDRAGLGGNGVAFVFDLSNAACSCPWDCGDGDGTVGILDFLALLAQWGDVGTSCDFDVDGVGILDFLALLANWGPCS